MAVQVKANGSWTGVGSAYVKVDGHWVTMGTPLPSISVLVKDDTGGIVSGATISIQTND